MVAHEEPVGEDDEGRGAGEEPGEPERGHARARADQMRTPPRGHEEGGVHGGEAGHGDDEGSAGGERAEMRRNGPSRLFRVDDGHEDVEDREQVRSITREHVVRSEVQHEAGRADGI